MSTSRLISRNELERCLLPHMQWWTIFDHFSVRSCDLNIKYSSVCCLVGCSSSTCSFANLWVKDLDPGSLFNWEEQGFLFEEWLVFCDGLLIVVIYNGPLNEFHWKACNYCFQFLLETEMFVGSDSFQKAIKNIKQLNKQEIKTE